MNDEIHDDDPGLVDDDPALDFILYKEMEKEDRQPRQSDGGCLSLVLFLLTPPAGLYLLVDKLL